MARMSTADIIAQTVAATLAALRAERDAERAERAERRANGTRVESPSQTMFRTRTAGTCVACGRSNFRTLKGAIGHLTNDAGDACVRTPERDAGFGVTVEAPAESK